MTTQHSPSPWTIDDNGWIDSPSGSVVEHAGCGSHSAEWTNPADTMLVLAAPDLLEGARLLLRALDEQNSAVITLHAEQLRLIIEKATLVPFTTDGRDEQK